MRIGLATASVVRVLGAVAVPGIADQLERADTVGLRLGMTLEETKAAILARDGGFRFRFHDK